MKLTNKLKALGLAGLIALAGCTGVPKPKSFPEQYGNLLLIKKYDNQMALYYDRDDDNQADLLLIYKINDIGEDGTFYLELIKRGDDKNRDGNFYDDGIVPYKVKPAKKLEAKDLI